MFTGWSQLQAGIGGVQLRGWGMPAVGAAGEGQGQGVSCWWHLLVPGERGRGSCRCWTGGLVAGSGAHCWGFGQAADLENRIGKKKIDLTVKALGCTLGLRTEYTMELGLIAEP